MLLVQQGLQIWGHPRFIVGKAPCLLGQQTVLHIHVVCGAVAEGVDVLAMMPVEFKPVCTFRTVSQGLTAVLRPQPYYLLGGGGSSESLPEGYPYP